MLQACHASLSMAVCCAAYVGSMGGTLYAAMAMHSYVLSIICCAAQARL